MKKNTLRFPTLSPMIFLIALTACGGGGDSSNESASAPPLSSISLTPANLTIPTEKTQQFAAAGTYSDGTTQDVTAQVTWSSSDTSVATINGSGLATIMAAGTTTITAISGNVSGSTTLTGSVWMKLLGTNGRDEGRGVAVDSSGNVYVAGFTSGALDGSTTAGSEDIFLLKYDSGGNKQWTRQLGSPSWDEGYGVAVDSSGNVYVTGLTTGPLDGNTYLAFTDAFLAKYDSEGNKQWTRQFGTNGYGWGQEVAVDSSGNVYVSGYNDIWELHNFPTDEWFTVPVDWEIFLVKYDSGGNEQWTQQVLKCGGPEYPGVAVDGSGNVYVNGGGYMTWGPYLSKYDSEGNKQWTTEWVPGPGVAVDSSGNVYVNGSVSRIEGMFLSKYDSEGNEQWTTENVPGPKVAVDSSGNVYVTGGASLAKYDSGGNEQWTRQLGTAGDVLAYSAHGVAVDNTGDVYVTGYTYRDLGGDTDAGTHDIFLLKFNSDGVLQ
jgi:hypothetical protein